MTSDSQIARKAAQFKAAMFRADDLNNPDVIARLEELAEAERKSTKQAGWKEAADYFKVDQATSAGNEQTGEMR